MSRAVTSQFGYGEKDIVSKSFSELQNKLVRFEMRLILLYLFLPSNYNVNQRLCGVKRAICLLLNTFLICLINDAEQKKHKQKQTTTSVVVSF